MQASHSQDGSIQYFNLRLTVFCRLVPAWLPRIFHDCALLILSLHQSWKQKSQAILETWKFQASVEIKEAIGNVDVVA